MVLKQAGYDVVSVTGTKKAKQVAESAAFDLFIIGHSAPREERVELVQWLRSRFETSRVLMLTKPYEGRCFECDCAAEAGDPQKLLEAVQNCAPLSFQNPEIAFGT